jgi:hypothetical protein
MEPQTELPKPRGPNQARPKKRWPIFLGDSLVGGSVAVMAFVPLTIIVAAVMDRLFIALRIDFHGNMEDFMVVWFFCLPAGVLGALGGLAGSALVRKRSTRLSPLIGAVAGGLIASLLVAVLMDIRIYKYWIADAKEAQVQATADAEKEAQVQATADAEMEKANLLIPVLEGDLQELTTIPSFIESLAVSPNGKLLAVAVNHEITFWDIGKKAPVGQIQTGFTSISENIQELAFSYDSRWLISSSDQLVVWSVADQKQVFTLEGHQFFVSTLSVSRSNSLATGDAHGVIIGSSRLPTHV